MAFERTPGGNAGGGRRAAMASIREPSPAGDSADLLERVRGRQRGHVVVLVESVRGGDASAATVSAHVAPHPRAVWWIRSTRRRWSRRDAGRDRRAPRSARGGVHQVAGRERAVVARLGVAVRARRDTADARDSVAVAATPRDGPPTRRGRRAPSCARPTPRRVRVDAASLAARPPCPEETGVHRRPGRRTAPERVDIRARYPPTARRATRCARAAEKRTTSRPPSSSVCIFVLNKRSPVAHRDRRPPNLDSRAHHHGGARLRARSTRTRGRDGPSYDVCDGAW